MNFLSNLVIKILRWLYELAQSDVKSEDAKKDDDLKKHLLNRIDAHERKLRIESDLRAKRTAGEAGGVGKDKNLDFRFKRSSGEIKK